MMFQKLEILKRHGYIPDTILDIGACKGEWTYNCNMIYPTANYLLFEPIKYPELNKLKDLLQNVSIFNELLDSVEGEVDWYEKQNTGDSMFRERTCHFQDCIPVKRNTVPLHSLVDDRISSMNHVFIKIDSQGAEIPILKGAGNILSKTDFILLEIPFFGQYNESVPGFLEHIKYMDEIGFVPFDLLETHMAKNFTIQVDILFISKGHSLNEKIQKELLE